MTHSTRCLFYCAHFTLAFYPLDWLHIHSRGHSLKHCEQDTTLDVSAHVHHTIAVRSIFSDRTKVQAVRLYVT